MEPTAKPVISLNGDHKELKGSTGMFRITEWAERRVLAKRKRRGLGDLKQRKKNPVRQMVANAVSLSIANFAVAPLERSRILMQTAPMSTYQAELPRSSRSMVPYIVKTQGVAALWRGTMPHIYG